MPPIEPVLVDKFSFRGLNGRPAWCRLEIIPLGDMRSVAIATEVVDNPGTSVTNVAEHLASFVCDSFRIEPDKLVWIEHYGYDGVRVRTYDLVSFGRRAEENIQWSEAVQRYHPDGWPGYFEEPEWRPMCHEDWEALRLAPRPSVHYEIRR